MMRAPIRPSALRLVLAGGVAATALLTAGAALALPVAGAGPYAVSPGGGQPIIATNANAVRVDLNAPRTIIDWQSFNLAGGERADFLFDQRNWIVLNRVTGSAISINGTVFGGQQANFNSPPAATPGGNVWFYSPQGVAFGASARVDVQLYEEAGGAVLIIADNGCGISPRQLADPKSIGIAGIRERVQALGGAVSISGIPGAGTTIEVRIPGSGET